MKKKFLILISILALQYESIAASTEDLPPLPTENIIVTSKDDGGSFWHRILNFFGLGDKKTGDGISQKPTQDENNKLVASDEPKLTEIAPTAASPPNTTPSSVPEIAETSVPEIVENVSNIPAPTSVPAVDRSLAPVSTTSEVPSAPAEQVHDLANTKDATSVTKDKAVSVVKADDGSNLQLPEGFADPDDSSGAQDIKVSTNPQKIIQQKTVDSNSKPPESEKSSQTYAQTPADDNLKLAESSSAKKPLDSEKDVDKTDSLPKIDEQRTAGGMTIPTSDNLSPKTEEGEDEILETQGSKIEASNTDISKYRKQLQERLNKPQNLPEISAAELEKKTQSPEQKINSEELAKQERFINDEMQVLKLADDDIVLGKLTDQARFELMDFSSYTKVFWENYNIIKNQPARKAIDDFIKDYDSEVITPSSKDTMSAFIDAFKAIDSDSIYSLINLVENYPILQMVDSNGNTLLHKAVYNNNYSAVKFLLIKGINVLATNYEGYSAMDIAISQNNQNLITLLHYAGAK